MPLKHLTRPHLKHSAQHQHPTFNTQHQTLNTQYQTLTTHPSPPTIHLSPPIAHRSPFIPHPSLLTLHSSPFTAHRSQLLLTAHRSPLTAHRSPSPLTAHSSLLTPHSSLVSPLTTHHLSSCDQRSLFSVLQSLPSPTQAIQMMATVKEATAKLMSRVEVGYSVRAGATARAWTGLG